MIREAPEIRTISNSQLRSKMANVISEVGQGLVQYLVVRHGELQAVLISPEDFRALNTANRILASPTLQTELETASNEIRTGQAIPVEDARQALQEAKERRLIRQFVQEALDSAQKDNPDGKLASAQTGEQALVDETQFKSLAASIANQLSGILDKHGEQLSRQEEDRAEHQIEEA